jgi:hypothetical protein
MTTQISGPYTDEGYATPVEEVMSRPTCHEVAVGPLFHDGPVPCLFHVRHAYPKFGKGTADTSASALKVRAFKMAGMAVSSNACNLCQV